MRAGRLAKRTRCETALADIERTVETFAAEIRREVASLRAELFTNERANIRRLSESDLDGGGTTLVDDEIS